MYILIFLVLVEWPVPNGVLSFQLSCIYIWLHLCEDITILFERDLQASDLFSSEASHNLVFTMVPHTPCQAVQDLVCLCLLTLAHMVLRLTCSKEQNCKTTDTFIYKTNTAASKSLKFPQIQSNPLKTSNIIISSSIKIPQKLFRIFAKSETKLLLFFEAVWEAVLAVERKLKPGVSYKDRGRGVRGPETSETSEKTARMWKPSEVQLRFLGWSFGTFFKGVHGEGMRLMKLECYWNKTVTFEAQSTKNRRYWLTS